MKLTIPTYNEVISCTTRKKTCMKQIKIMVLSKRLIKKYIIIIGVSTLSVYFLISIYFVGHYFFHTEINCVNVSLKSHNKLDNIINSYIQNYELKMIGRNGNIDIIRSKDIGMKYNINNSIKENPHLQNPFFWIGSLFKKHIYYVNDLYMYDNLLLNKKIKNLKCINSNIIEPKNVDFQYNNGVYELIEESYGNKIKIGQLINTINSYIISGRTELNLSKTHCYVEPTYTLNSEKTIRTRKLLNKYVSTKITYQFGPETELLDGNTIHEWLSVDHNLDVTINKQAITEYITSLSKKYNTVGMTREFTTSTGLRIEVSGGIYGWKINSAAESEALYNHIINADDIQKEPIYSQRAITREGNEIGNTYVEINITRQHLWFYKDGTLITQGSIVTGNPNRGNATVLGVYMINYKQRGATLTGPDYAAKVTYWMPFFGHIGLHDASWRYRFGGEIYKRNGSHGCVNLPLYLAKIIYENIEEGTPIIVYEETK